MKQIRPRLNSPCNVGNILVSPNFSLSGIVPYYLPLNITVEQQQDSDRRCDSECGSECDSELAAIPTKISRQHRPSLWKDLTQC
jgi:hypothetical protein